jgi:uncharacterized protein YcnI
MKKWTSGLAMAMMALFLFAGIASAHVTVWPKETKQGSYEVFSVRVPSETEGTQTVKVKIAAADGAGIIGVEPKPGWTYEAEKKEDGSFASVTWTADGKGLNHEEFTEFRFQGKVGDDATQLVWKAYQTYADKSVVEWIGAPDADKPASVTTVVPASGESGGHGAAANAGTAADNTAEVAEPAAGTDVTAADSGKTALDTVTLIIAIAALVLSLITLVAAVSRKRK